MTCTEEPMKPYVEALKALADETRLRIMRLLVVNQTAMCVCELVDSLEEQQYNVSRHLQILEAAGLIEGTKEGRWVYYRLPTVQDSCVRSLYKAVAELPAIDETVAADQARFRERMHLREGGRCQVGIQKRYLLDGRRHGQR
jgi:ArsR family transcriptional regulator, arsenate/arsenite/antimonite-responsive transcriptional repressor